MHHTISQIKGSARNNLLGHYGLAIGSIIAVMAVILLLNLPFRRMMIQGFLFHAYTRVAIGIIGVVIVVMIAILANAGIAWLHLNLARGRKVMFRDIFFPFTNQPGKFLGIGGLWVVTALICLLPGLICLFLSVNVSFADFSYEIVMPIIWYVCNLALLAGIIVYIIIIMSWSLSICLILDNPDLRVMQAVRRSRKMLKKKRRRRFVMLLSFVGWGFFSILTFFIALLWIMPYVRQSLICFYLAVLEEEDAS